MQPLPTHPRKAPRRKFRGKKRHFRGIVRDAQLFVVDTRADAWWNLWHCHTDWRGWGNLRWKYRLGHLRAQAIVFRKIVQASLQISVPFQAWWSLHVEDAGVDAVYLHSPNPYGTPFPWKAEGIDWTTEVLGGLMEDLLPGVSVRVGRWDQHVGNEATGEPSTTYLIYAPGIGVPLE